MKERINISRFDTQHLTRLRWRQDTFAKGVSNKIQKRGSKPIIEEITGLPTEGASTVAALRLLRRKKDRPDAILTIQDRPAIGVLEAVNIDRRIEVLLIKAEPAFLLGVNVAIVKETHNKNGGHNDRVEYYR